MLKKVDWKKMAGRTVIAIDSASVIIPNYPSNSMCTHVILAICDIVIITSWFFENKE